MKDTSTETPVQLPKSLVRRMKSRAKKNGYFAKKAVEIACREWLARESDKGKSQ